MASLTLDIPFRKPKYDEFTNRSTCTVSPGSASMGPANSDGPLAGSCDNWISWIASAAMPLSEPFPSTGQGCAIGSAHIRLAFSRHELHSFLRRHANTTPRRRSAATSLREIVDDVSAAAFSSRGERSMRGRIVFPR